ncbi:MAG TPA: histidine kinase [Parafilimonas sp.]
MKLPGFIFSNKWLYRLSRHLTFWAGRILFVTVAQITRIGYQNYAQNFVKNFSQNFVFLIEFSTLMVLVCEVGFCYSIVYFLAPRYLLKKKYFLFILYFFLIVLLFDLLGIIFQYWYFNIKWSYTDFLFYWNTTIEFLNDGVISSTAVFLSFKLFKTWYLKQAEGQMLAKVNAESEMQILKTQVQPHFLFNTLNNIYAFILNKSPKANELVSNLYEIMKYMINDCNVEIISLAKDLKMIQDYIELEKVRYGKRLDIVVSIEGEYQNKMVTPLLMIPFVENSFKHGASKMLSEPWIQLTIQADEKILHFTVTNNKPPTEIFNKNGIGLNNVKKRLELLYPQNHLLIIESTENTFTVNMQIPLQKINEKIVA